MNVSAAPLAPAYSLYAHTPNPKGEWHRLTDHLAGTARRAELFGAAFGAGDFGRVVGWLHDVGKCSCIFSAYLQTCESDGDGAAKALFPVRDHKMAGAILAQGTHSKWGFLLATTILGHHGGMPDLSESASRINEARDDPSLAETLATASGQLELPDFTDLAHPAWLDEAMPKSPEGYTHIRDVEMYMRLVFSALVDADWLDTEAHFSPEHEAVREPNRGLTGLLQRFETRREGLLETSLDSPVNEARTEIYDELARVTGVPPGLYRLSAPTGAGKTLLGLGWALRHAEANNLRRIVTAVPFISVTDQVAAVYRDFLDADNDRVVLEHHSQVIDGEGWQRLAAENWDSPVVVTTTVRLFEALFSNRPSDCRRLHRLAGSIIVLDEVQALPIEVLEPIVDALRALVTRFGATVLLMTATQPTLEHVPSSNGVGATDLLPEAERWAATFQRTRHDWVGTLDHAAVGALIAEREQCLCIVNTISDAEEITRSLADPDSIHLTTRLRPSDRRDRLQDIRDRLDSGSPCRVVSTQLVEAGVDLDFPAVLRAVAPLPSLLQADGRCNRNGLLDRLGETIVFDLVGGKAPGGIYYEIGRPHTLALMGNEGVNPWSPEGVEVWYQRLLTDQMAVLDSRDVQSARQNLAYREVARRFRMIDDNGLSVVVPWSSDDHRSMVLERSLEHLKKGLPSGRSTYRVLQDATISLRTQQVERCLVHGLVVRIGSSDLYEWIGTYDEQVGVIFTPLAQIDMIL
jgi:CRISPR-associated endonuclease/helicase Cas3